MAAVLVGQFHARDAEGRVYSVHEFEDTQATGDQPVMTYKLAIGDRVKKMMTTTTSWCSRASSSSAILPRLSQPDLFYGLTLKSTDETWIRLRNAETSSAGH